MELHLGPKKDPSHQQSLGTPEKNALPRAIQKSNAQDKFGSQKRGLSYADLHGEITKNVNDVFPRNSGNSLKQQSGKVATGDKGNLVKYKSYLPVKVKKAEHLQDKFLKAEGNKEKLQHDVNQIQNSSRHSVSTTTNTSSSLCTDDSSVGSSGDLNYSPSCQRTNHPPLKYFLMSSHSERRSQVFKPSGVNVGNTQVRDSSLKEQTDSILKEGRSCQSLSSTGFRQHEKKVSDTETIKSFQSAMNCKVSPCTKSQDGEVKKSKEKTEGNLDVCVGNVCGKEQTATLFVPRIVPQKHHSGVSKFSDSAMLLAGRQTEISQKSFLDRPKECQNTEQNSELPLSYLFLREVDGYRKMQSKRIGFMNTEKNNHSAERSCSAPRSRKTQTSLSAARNLEDRAPNLISTRNEPLEGSDRKCVDRPSEKARSISPFRRLSFSMGKTSKGSSSKDGQTVPGFTKPSSETALAPSSSDGSSRDRASAASRGRSSPLRRLLEPLMKPKAGNSCKVEPAQKGSTSNHVRNAVSNGQPCSSSLQSGDGKSSTVQALFHVTVKNDQPLFTFAVDKEHNIITATLNKQTDLDRADGTWMYRFSTVQGVRKKNARWINQGGKYQSGDYISTTVAHMRISGSRPPSVNATNCMDQCIFREFVLFASGSQPSNELAAIFIKIPRRVDRNVCWSENKGIVSEAQSKEYLTDINATVILPSGIHSLPHKGGPSSLIQRWKTGGSCDCGGWDMGCNLRILNNRHQFSEISTSFKASSISDQFELFFQGEQQDDEPFLRISSYKEGIYSVEYKSSLTLLQAFSSCIAIYDSKRLLEVTEPKNGHEEISSGETVLVHTDRLLKPSSGLVEGEIPGRYVSYPPPLSPVGRV